MRPMEAFLLVNGGLLALAAPVQVQLQRVEARVRGMD